MTNEFRFNGTRDNGTENYHAIVCWQDFNCSWYVDVNTFDAKTGEPCHSFIRSVPDHGGYTADRKIDTTKPYRTMDPRKVAQAVVRNPEAFV